MLTSHCARPLRAFACWPAFSGGFQLVWLTHLLLRGAHHVHFCAWPWELCRRCSPCGVGDQSTRLVSHRLLLARLSLVFASFFSLRPRRIRTADRREIFFLGYEPILVRIICAFRVSFVHPDLETLLFVCAFDLSFLCLGLYMYFFFMLFSSRLCFFHGGIFFAMLSCALI